MEYKKKYVLFKQLIDKKFSSYEKKYCFNLLNETYQVQFIFKDPYRIMISTILPDSKWYEYRKQIERRIANMEKFSQTKPECKICFNQMNFIASCRYCSFNICNDCIKKIQIESDVFSCPQCRYIPGSGERYS